MPRRSPAPRPPRRPPRPSRPTPVTIGDLGTVELGAVADDRLRADRRQPALTLTVTKTSDANTVKVADAVQAKLDEIGARHPGAADHHDRVRPLGLHQRVADGLLREGGLGALFAILTIFLFLFSVRSTLVAAISSRSRS